MHNTFYTILLYCVLVLRRATHELSKQKKESSGHMFNKYCSSEAKRQLFILSIETRKLKQGGRATGKVESY